MSVSFTLFHNVSINSLQLHTTEAFKHKMVLRKASNEVYLAPPLRSTTLNTDEMNLGASQTIKSILPWMIHSPGVYVQLDSRWILTIWNYL